MDIRNEIASLKKERDAVILAHNYCLSEVQDMADFVGDSLALAIEATKVEAGTLVFCGVRFMAEGAKILNPGKTVLMPQPEALCPMASMCTASQIEEEKERHPRAAVVGYVNSTAASKTVMDVCCTSANAVNVVNSLDEEEIIFVPDYNLGSYVQTVLPGKRIIRWNGYCPTHQAITGSMVDGMKEEHPAAEILVHPECRPPVLAKADFIGSTAGIMEYACRSHCQEFIIGTEVGMIHRLRVMNPEKKFYALESAVCPTMKMTDLESVYASLRDMKHEVILDEEVMSLARRPLERMLGIRR